MAAAPPSARLLQDCFRFPLERAVSAHFGLTWRARAFTGLDDLSSHPAAVLADGERAVFAKLSEAANGLDQFEVELSALRLLTDRAGVRIPTPVGVLNLEQGSLLVMEAVRPVERGPEQWRDVGRSLARIHLVTGAACGLDRQGYFGPLYQDNRPLPDWLDFYIERRLYPRLAGAVDTGAVPGAVMRLVDRLAARLPALEIPRLPPLLLHGDAQQNNYISTAQGALVIDPAPFYGHPEYDLAYLDYFAPVPPDVFDGYREIRPIDPGFWERRELWRIPAYLAMVQVAGPGELGKLVAALKRYL